MEIETIATDFTVKSIARVLAVLANGNGMQCGHHTMKIATFGMVLTVNFFECIGESEMCSIHSTLCVLYSLCTDFSALIGFFRFFTMRKNGAIFTVYSIYSVYRSFLILVENLNPQYK